MIRKNNKRNIKLECQSCGKKFERMKSEHTRNQKKGRRVLCSLKCSGSINHKHLDKYKGDTAGLKKWVSNNPKKPFCFFNYCIKNARARTKVKVFNSFDINVNYLKEIWDKQKGVCPYTGYKMSLPKEEGVKAFSLKASLDRIDPSKGYIKGNVEFVCYCANMAKNTLSRQEMQDFFKNIPINKPESNRILS